MTSKIKLFALDQEVLDELGSGIIVEGLPIHDDSVFKVTGTAISFDDGLDVSVTGSIAYVQAADGEKYNPDETPDSPSSYDDEFDDESIAGKWTITNNPAGADAISETDYYGYIHVGLQENANDDFDNSVRMHQSPPTGTYAFEYIIKASIAQIGGVEGGELGEWAQVGVYLGNSTDDEHLVTCLELNNGITYLATNSVFQKGHGTAADNQYVQTIPLSGGFAYLKLAKTTDSAYTSANTYKGYVSLNGIIWWELGYQSFTFTSDCDEVGIYFRNPKSQSGTVVVYSLVDFFRKVL